MSDPAASPSAGSGELPIPAEAVAADEGERLAACAAAYIAAGSAANTRRAYLSHWTVFSTWCARRGRLALPAHGDTVADFLMDQAAGSSISTLKGRKAAIWHKHKFEDAPLPGGRRLHEIWAGILRVHGRPPRQKRAIITDDLRRIVAVLPTDLTGLRDRALLLLGFASALRRDELARVTIGAQKRARGSTRLFFAPAGLELELGASKADQEGKGAFIGVPNGATELCPVRAVRAWLDAAQITTGPVFRPIDQWGHVAAEAISGRAVAEIVKARAALIGIDPAEVGGHSLRAGMVTQAILNNVDPILIMKVTRHARLDTVQTYIRVADRFRMSASGNLGL